MYNSNWTSSLNKRTRYILLTAGSLLAAVATVTHLFENHAHSIARTKIALPSEKTVPQTATQITAVTPSSQQVTETTQFRSSVIHHSIEAAVLAAGLPKKMAHEVFAMFTANGEARNAHPGDRINILYHEYFIGNKKDHPGNVVAAEIMDGKKEYRMVRFVAPNHTVQFYTSSGKGTKPLFLPFPLRYKRIGSRFNYHRYDPVLHKIRPHLGVDFDAPIGTPVRAISNGVVLFSKQMRGYGNVLMIRYRNRYKTLYAHLERFASYIKPNKRVKKGEVVGYVGSTGWSTGPHLHFAVYKNGVPVNPLTVQFPHGSAIPEKYRQDFFQKTNRWFSQMRLYESVNPRIKRISHRIGK